MSVNRQAWVNVAFDEMRRGGVDCISVERLATILGVTKGSFYWHFSTRQELLEELLRGWERETDALIAAAEEVAAPLGRVLTFFEIVAANRGKIPDTEFFTWARHDKTVRRRASVVEAKRIGFIRDQLRAAGVARIEAGRRAQVGYLATLGWIERASRHKERSPAPDFRRFTDYLFKWLFGGIAAEGLPRRRRRRARSVSAAVYA